MAGSYQSFDSSRVDFADSKITNELKRLRKLGADMQPAMLEISEYLHTSTRDRFDQGKAPDDTPWATLSPKTLARKKSKGVPINDPLHGETLHLRDMIFPFSSDTEAGVSTGPGTEKYAATHQFGDEERNIEAREFLGLSDEDEMEILEIVGGYFD